MHFSSDDMEVQLRAFGRRTFAELIPIVLNGILIKVSDLANGEVKLCYPRFIIIASFEDCLIQNGFRSMKFAYQWAFYLLTSRKRIGYKNIPQAGL